MTDDKTADVHRTHRQHDAIIMTHTIDTLHIHIYDRHSITQHTAQSTHTQHTVSCTPDSRHRHSDNSIVLMMIDDRVYHVRTCGAVTAF